jgi:hypothetical protein
MVGRFCDLCRFCKTVLSSVLSSASELPLTRPSPRGAALLLRRFLPRPVTLEKRVHVLVDVAPARSEPWGELSERLAAMRSAKVEVFEERNVDRVLHRIVTISDDAVGYAKAGVDRAHVAAIDGGLRVVAERVHLDTFEAVVLVKLGTKVGICRRHELNESRRVDRFPWHGATLPCMEADALSRLGQRQRPVHNPSMYPLPPYRTDRRSNQPKPDPPVPAGVAIIAEGEGFADKPYGSSGMMLPTPPRTEQPPPIAGAD